MSAPCSCGHGSGSHVNGLGPCRYCVGTPSLCWVFSPCDHRNTSIVLCEGSPAVCEGCGMAMTNEEYQQVMRLRAADVGVASTPHVVDMVNHPPHYRSNVSCPNCGHKIQCIDVIRQIRDGRLFTTMKYVWRVALGGGKANDREDIEKAVWYLNDWLEHDVSHDQ